MARSRDLHREQYWRQRHQRQHPADSPLPTTARVSASQPPHSTRGRSGSVRRSPRCRNGRYSFRSTSLSHPARPHSRSALEPRLSCHTTSASTLTLSPSLNGYVASLLDWPPS